MLKQRARDTELLRGQGKPTVPSTIKLEKSTNPFLRCKEPEIIRHIEQQYGIKLAENDDQTAFTLMRKWRDQF